MNTKSNESTMRTTWMYKEKTNKIQLTDKGQQRVVIVLFLLIPVTLLALFSYYPASRLIELSFTNWNGISPAYKYIGFSNYLDIFTDSSILQAFKNNLAYVLAMFVQTLLALYLAIILDGQIRGRNGFRLIIFLPYILNGVAVAFMFNYLYDYNNGPLNLILKNIGLGDHLVHWLGNNYAINFSLAAIGIWRYTGFAMVIFLGALQSIPVELYEAASIDGAGFIQSVKYITIPGIKRVIELNLFLGLNGAMQAYFEPFIITKGGPAGLSETFVTKTLKVAFDFQKFGKASAMGVILMILILSFVAIQRRFIKRLG